MLGQTARNLLSTSSMFRKLGADKEDHDKQTAPDGAKSSVKSALRLKWRSAKRRHASPVTSGVREDASSNEKTSMQPDANREHVSNLNAKQQQQQPQQHRHDHRERQSSPSAGDLSSGYLSQTNGFSSLLVAAVRPATKSGGDVSTIVSDRDESVARLGHHQVDESGASSHPQLARLGEGLQHSHSFASSTVRLPLVPMMIDDDDDGYNNGEEPNAESDDADDGHRFELECNQQSYQLMIDGLKRRQHEQRRRQQHQLDDKLSPMTMMAAAAAAAAHKGVYGEECVDSELESALELRQSTPRYQSDLRHLHHDHDHHGHDHHLSALSAYTLSAPGFDLASYTPHPAADRHHQQRQQQRHRLYDHHHDVTLYQRMLAAPVFATYHERTARNASLDPDQRRPAIVYNQPEVRSGEHYARLNNSNHHHHQRRIRDASSNTFLQDRNAHNTSRSSKTSHRQQLETLNDRQHRVQPPKLPPKKTTNQPPAPPRPPTRDHQQHQHQIRGQLHQAAGQARPNLASPLGNKRQTSRYRHHEEDADGGQIGASLALVHSRSQPIMSGNYQAGSKHLTGALQQFNTSSHHSNPQQLHPQQPHISKRSKSNSQLSAALNTSDKQQQQQQQRRLAGNARAAPKSISGNGGSIVNGTTPGGASSHPAGKMSANLQAMSHRNRDGLSMTTPSAVDMGCCGKMAKFLLFIANILFWCAGVALGAWGILALVEDHKYNLSQLLVFEPSSRMSLFQLLAWSFITLGGATILIGICGCSAMFKNSRWILGLYIFLILAIFALDLATGLLAIIFQERLVANVRLRLVSKLRNEYGIQASFTAAIDYIQTRYECCGMEGHFDYEQSLWRLQRLGGFEATVARTCCQLRNTLDDQAHVNPRPVNESMCQSTDVRFHQSYRFRRGCLDDLERLIRHKIWTFTIGCGIVGAIILLVLALATCFCRSIPDENSGDGESGSQISGPSRKNTTPNRVHQQALMYAETVAKKQGNHHSTSNNNNNNNQHHQHHLHHHHQHQMSSSSSSLARHK